MSPTELETFRTWIRDVILPTASERDNNWGDAGTFARIALTSYLGDAAGFDAAVARWREMMDFVAADGHIPEEVRRESKGIMYTQEALQYKVGSAVIAARRGVDLWDYQGAAGRHAQGLDRLSRVVSPSSRTGGRGTITPNSRRRAPCGSWSTHTGRTCRTWIC